MPTMTEVREGTVASVDTWTKLTYLGGSTAIQDSTVPPWAHSIKQIAVTAGVDGAAAAGVIMVKFANATTHGDQIIAVLGHGNIGTTVGIAGCESVMDVDFGVVPGKALRVYGCYAGGDSGTPELGVTFTYSDKPGGHTYATRQAALTTADAWQSMNTEDGTTGVDDLIVQGPGIDQVICVAGYGSTTQEPQVAYVRLQGVAGSIEGNEHTFGCPSYVVSDGTLADTYINKANVFDVDIACPKAGTVRLQGMSSGATVTTDPEVAMTVAFRL